MKRLYLLLALAACNSAPPLLSPSGYSGAELPTPLPMPDLVLTDSQGEPYHLAESTRGKVALVFFGYTSCPDICPVHLANIAAVLHKLPDEVRREVEVIFITTDPARDSLPRLREWVRQFDRGFVGLTGPDSLIAAAERALGVFPAVVDSANSRGYLVQHAGQVIAFTRDGMARVQYPFGTRQRDWARDLPKLLAADE
jgi:protein SCO1/2